MNQFKKLLFSTAALIITFTTFNAKAADAQINVIYNYLTQIKIYKSVDDNAVRTAQTELLDKTEQYYKKTFEYLQNNELTILKVRPQLELHITSLVSKNDFAMSASLQEPLINLWYNRKGQHLQLTENDKIASYIKKKNLKIKAPDIYEFSLFHEIAHIQHFNAPEIFEITALSREDNYQLGFLYSEHFSHGVDKDIRDQFFENYADFVATVWYLKKYNFSQTAIAVIADIATMRKLIDRQYNALEVHSYKTQDSIAYILANTQTIKDLKAAQIHALALEKAGNFSLKQIQSIPAKLQNNSPIHKEYINIEKKLGEIAALRRNHLKL